MKTLFALVAALFLAAPAAAAPSPSCACAACGCKDCKCDGGKCACPACMATYVKHVVNGREFLLTPSQAKDKDLLKVLKALPASFWDAPASCPGCPGGVCPSCGPRR